MRCACLSRLGQRARLTIWTVSSFVASVSGIIYAVVWGTTCDLDDATHTRDDAGGGAPPPIARRASARRSSSTR